MTRAIVVALIWSAVCLGLALNSYDPVEAAEDGGEALAQLAWLAFVGAVWVGGAVAIIVFVGKPRRSN